MRTAAVVVGMIGSFFGSFLAIRNFGIDAVLILFGSGGSVGFFLLEAILLLLYLAGLVASVTILFKLRAGAILLVACTIGVTVFGGLELYLYLRILGLPQEVSLFASPFLYPVIAASFILAARYSPF